MKDQYLINMRFAEELMRFLQPKVTFLLGFNTGWDPKLAILELDDKIDVSLFNKEAVSVFNEQAGWAVFYIIEENVNDIIECYEDFFNELNAPENNIDDIDAYFARCALKIAPLFFSKGYNHGAFLGYCAMVMGVAFNFLLFKPNGIPQRACQIIGLVLFMHQMTGEFYEERGWSGCDDVCFNFNKVMADSQEKWERTH